MSTGDVMSQQPVNRLPLPGIDNRRVRRSLFGPPNIEETRNFVRKELEKQMLIDKEKWNFDFANERPLNGPGKRYEWVKVESGERCSTTEQNGKHDEDESNFLNGVCSEHDGVPKENGQTHITDFMRKRKFCSTPPKHDSTTSQQQSVHQPSSTT